MWPSSSAELPLGQVLEARGSFPQQKGQQVTHIRFVPAIKQAGGHEAELGRADTLNIGADERGFLSVSIKKVEGTFLLRTNEALHHLPVLDRDLIRDVIWMQGGVRFANVAQHTRGISVNQIAEVRTSGAALAPNTMAFRALKLSAEKEFTPMLPIAVRFAWCAAVRASRSPRLGRLRDRLLLLLPGKFGQVFRQRLRGVRQVIVQVNGFSSTALPKAFDARQRDRIAH